MSNTGTEHCCPSANLAVQLEKSCWERFKRMSGVCSQEKAHRIVQLLASELKLATFLTCVLLARIALSAKLMFPFNHWQENDNNDIIIIYSLTDTSEGVYLASRFSGKSPLWPFWTNFCNLNEQDHFLVNTLLKSLLKRLFRKQHLIFLGILFYLCMSVLIECLYANHTGTDGSKLPCGFWELKWGPVELQGHSGTPLHISHPSIQGSESNFRPARLSYILTWRGYNLSNGISNT